MTFSLGRGYRISIFFGAAFLLLVAPLVGQEVVSPGQSWGGRALFVVWLIAMLYGLYQNLYQLAYELQSSDNMLTWRSPLRTGRLPLSELRRIYSSRVSLGVLEAADGRRIQIYAQKGFRTFVSRLVQRNPNIDVSLSWYFRLVERLPGTTAFHG
jgi:hypothetical protein